MGEILYLSDDHFFHLKFGLGEGTNNRAELRTLYMLLIFAHENGIQGIQIFGESMIIINWINQTQRCHNIYLKFVLEEVD